MRRIHAFTLFLTLLLLGTLACQAPSTDSADDATAETVTLSGTLRTARPTPLAEVHFKASDDQEAEKVSVAAADDGTFSIELGRRRPYQLELTAVGHQAVRLPVLLDTDASLNVILAANRLKEPLEEALIFGDWPGSSRRKAEAMERREDGTFAFLLELEADPEADTERTSVKYQLSDVTTHSNTINGTQAASYEYDGGGDYWSVVPVADGRVEIVFDPSRLPAADQEGLPRIESDDPLIAKTVEFEDEVRAIRTAQRARTENDEAPETEVAYADLRRRALALAEDTTASASLRHLGAIRALGLPGDLADEDEQRLVSLLGTDSPFWSFESWAIAELDGDLHRETLEGMRTGHPDPRVRGLALVSLTAAAKKSGDEELWRRLHAELAEGYGEDHFLEYYVKGLDPASLIQVDLPAPEFQMTLLDGARFQGSDQVSLGSFEGRYVLIDFWATWCGPCVAEMPKMHEAWKRYGGNGKLQFLSVSFDHSVDQIAPFRDEKWAMPWLHGFLAEGFDSDVAKSYEVNGIPKPVLIGPDGRIVAVEDSLRGDQLLATLGRLLDGEA